MGVVATATAPDAESLGVVLLCVVDTIVNVLVFGKKKKKKRKKTRTRTMRCFRAMYR